MEDNRILARVLLTASVLICVLLDQQNLVRQIRLDVAVK